MENKTRKEHKIYVITKLIEGKMTGLLKESQLQRIRLANSKETPENTLDALFKDYLENFFKDENDRQYWMGRYIN